MAGSRSQCHLTLGKEHLRCYKYETENVLVRLSALLAGGVGGARKAPTGKDIFADDVWIGGKVSGGTSLKDKQENICVLL